MAPVNATVTGVARQIIDDPDLINLLDRLKRTELTCNDSKQVDDTTIYKTELKGASASRGKDCGSNSQKVHDQVPLELHPFLQELSQIQKWRFQEQADLYEWIKPLNAIDFALSHFLKTYPALLLIPPIDDRERITTDVHLSEEQAESSYEANNVPSVVTDAVKTLLRFLSQLLRNSTNKSVFNSVYEVSDLLAAGDDEIASLAIEVLSSLAHPPLLHRLQAPEMQQHTTTLTSLPASSSPHSRLMALARGWGSRGSGLGLEACVSADDSESDCVSLPSHAGEVSFEFYGGIDNPTTTALSPASQNTPVPVLQTPKISVSRHVKINLIKNDILQEEPDDCQAEKRRRMGSPNERKSLDSHPYSFHNRAKSTAELFFLSIDKAGGRHCLPPSKAFLLLSQIRLARSFYSHETRVAAVESRLRALTCILHSHPSQDALSGYFQAQPELCSEIADLVRPTVASANVSSLSRLWVPPMVPKVEDNDADVLTSHTSAIDAVADSGVIPFSVRTLAVETLTALVSRRDGVGSALTNVARQANVLTELGVGKGQFLGLLPALIRFTLAAFSAFLSENKEKSSNGFMMETEDDVDLQVGLAFLQASKVPLMPGNQGEERALEFIDSVLTLTSAVISVPTGTAALVDCGLIPAIVSAIAQDSKVASLTNKFSDDTYTSGLFTFIIGQAIQLIEGAVATLGHALSAFNDLNGVDILVNRLHVETEYVRINCGNGHLEGSNGENCALMAARRVLLFSIVNCLTVVFHQQDSSSNHATSGPSGGAQLRKGVLSESLKDILDNVDSYGGVMAALTATLLSDVMNADPQVVHHVHKSGLATSFLRLLSKKECNNEENSCIDLDWKEPSLPQSSELIMAIPNVISALSLTEDGAKSIKNENPFPSLLSIFCCPKYAMPYSRCLLNEMAAIVGTGLDEIMRHVPRLKPLVMSAIVRAMHRIIYLGNNLRNEEDDHPIHLNKLSDDNQKYSCDATEIQRTCIMQYAYNIGQMLEQILHSEDHCGPFVDAGGVEAILDTYPLLIPGGRHLLSHISCQSSPSLASLTHSTTTNAFVVAIKGLSSHNDPHKIIQKVTDGLNKELDKLSKTQNGLRQCSNATNVLLKIPLSSEEDESGENKSLNISGILEGVPNLALHMLEAADSSSSVVAPLSCFLRNILSIEWHTNVLSSIIRVACQRHNEIGGGFSRREREWQKLITSEQFTTLIVRMSLLHISTMYEVCRIRTKENYEEQDLERWKVPDDDDCKIFPTCYRLRIVCAEGAVVRDGIEIDSCLSVGNLEMGEIVDAFDRCINTSGIMRYQTSRGWISEQTRGHGREPIAEVLSIHGSINNSSVVSKTKSIKRRECGIPDLSSVSAAILARLQSSHAGLCSCLSRAMIAGARSLPISSIPSVNGTMNFLKTLTKVISKVLQANFNALICPQIFDKYKEGTGVLSRPGMCMYFGNMISILNTCLYEEKRERKVLNLPLLVHLIYSDGFSNEYVDSMGHIDDSSENNLNTPLPTQGVLAGIRFVMIHGFVDLEKFARRNFLSQSKGKLSLPLLLRQRMSRSVAVSMPSAVELLRKLSSRSMLVDSHLVSMFRKMKETDLNFFLNRNSKTGEKFMFNVVHFARSLHSNISKVVSEFWNNPLLVYAPAHVVNPITSLIGELLQCLEDSVKTNSGNERNSSCSNRRGAEMIGGIGNNLALDRSVSDLRLLSRNLSDINPFIHRALSRDIRNDGETGNVEVELGTSVPTQPFEPSEETITQLVEMGFSREHALEAIETSESNRLEIAMEYALAHPPPDAASIERRQAAREARARRQAIVENSRSQNNDHSLSGAQTGGDDNVSHQDDLSPQGMDTANAANHSESSHTHIHQSSANSEESNNASNLKEESENEKISKGEKKKNLDEEADAFSLAQAIESLKILKKSVIGTGIRLIEGGNYPINVKNASHDSFDTMKKIFELRRCEAESVTIVSCSFLLEICEKYPSERSIIVVELIERLKRLLQYDIKDLNCLHNEKLQSFASVCHASVILLRALPHTRPILLRFNIIGRLLHRLREFASKLRQESSSLGFLWPEWIAPSFLLLDIMAQPVSISLEDTDEEIEAAISSKGDSGSGGKRCEFARVCLENKRQRLLLSKMAKRIHVVLNNDGSFVSTKKKKCKDKDSRKNYLENNKDTREDKSEVSFPFENIPSFLPLITHDAAEQCLSVCVQILRSQQKRQDTKDMTNNKYSISSDIIHAMILLLSRVIRSHKIALQFLEKGGTELILSLNRKSRFSGHSGLLTIVLRRLLEDETTLQTSMETEIRSTVAKLHKKSPRRSESSRPQVQLRLLIQSISPLICRDPLAFLKAAATSIRIVTSDAGTVVTNQMNVVLLNAEERSKNSKALLECFKTNHSGVGSLQSPSHFGSNRQNASVPNKSSPKPGIVMNISKARGKQAHKSKSPITTKYRSKSPRPNTHTSKRGKQDLGKKRSTSLHGSPANHVISLLISELLKASDEENFSNHTGILSVVDLLEVIANLVLAVPACAAAIHRYHPPSGRDQSSLGQTIMNVGHALSFCPPPPNNAVSFLLHRLLPQPRIYKKSFNQLSSSAIENDNEKHGVEFSQRKEALTKVKISQFTARLLVALVARAGEGRRRIISDLVLALNGGGQDSSISGQTVQKSSQIEDEDHEMWALLAWGELCIGLAAPRSSSVNQDSNSSLSFEVVKVMLECGMAHALMSSIQRIRLHHPLASTAAAAIIRPLEVFTRQTVVDTVKEMANKEQNQTKQNTSRENDGTSSSKGAVRKGSSSLARRITLGPSQQSESAFADDAMLEDGFDADTAERNARRNARRRNFNDIDNQIEEDDNDDDEFMEDSIAMHDEVMFGEEGEEEEDYDASMSVDEDESTSAEDDDDEEEDSLNEASENESEDEDIESDESDVYSSSDASDAETVDSDNRSNNDVEDNYEVDVEDIEENNGPDWNEMEQDDDFFEGHEDIEEDVDDANNNVMDGEVGGDWTRIDSGNIGSMIFGGGARSIQIRGNRQSSRPGGFMFEAAEAMIENLLRAEVHMGDAQAETLAEIENTLGIRLMGQRRDMEQRPFRSTVVRDTTGRFASRPSIIDNTNLNRRNEGAIGLIPSVSQTHPPDNGFSSISTAGRLGDLNSMESLYGAHFSGISRMFYDVSGTDLEDESGYSESSSLPSSVDLQLFPGGPAASTHSRAHQNPHPLISGVNLPPFNSLVSISRHTNDLLVEEAAESADFGFGGMLASSQGNVIRLSRNTNHPLSDRSRVSNNIGTIVEGWTDDGRPLDNTGTEFSLAFERALEQTITQNSSSSQDRSEGVAANNNETTTNNLNIGVSSGDHISQEESAISNTQVDNSSSNDHNDDNDQVGESIHSQQDTTDATSPQEVANATSQNTNTLETRQLSFPNDVRPNSTEGLNSGISVSTEGNSGAHLQSGRDLRDLSGVSRTDGDESFCLMPQESGMNATVANENVLENIQESSNDLVSNEIGPTVDESSNLQCPPGMDHDVFHSLPLEMQQEIVTQHQSTESVAAQLDSSSGLDPVALAALPEDMRQEVIQQDQQERRMREQQQAPADPSNAEEMDNASFVASLAPDLREEILLTADETLLNSLPPDIIAEAHLLRERASSRHRRSHEETSLPASSNGNRTENQSRRGGPSTADTGSNEAAASSNRKRNKVGRIRVSSERSSIVYMPHLLEREVGHLVTSSSMKSLIKLMYLLSPIRPQRLLQKLFQNLCGNPEIRMAFLITFVSLLNDEPHNVVYGVKLIDKESEEEMPSQNVATMAMDNDFPPLSLIGTPPEIIESDSSTSNFGFFRRQTSAAAAIAANLPVSAKGSLNGDFLPPVVARRIVGTISFLSRGSLRIAIDFLSNFSLTNLPKDDGQMCLAGNSSIAEKLFGLLVKPFYSQSSSNLEELLSMIETLCQPLSSIPSDSEQQTEITKKDIESAQAIGKEWVEVPRIIISEQNLHILCSVLKLESCRDASFAKISNITKRLCRVKDNRDGILKELASVAQSLGADAIRDLRSLRIRLNDAAIMHRKQIGVENLNSDSNSSPINIPSNAVTLSVSTSEVKLLRVLQTLHTLCGDPHMDSNSRKSEGFSLASQELTSLFQGINLTCLWDQLESCLQVVSVLEGIAHLDELEADSIVNDDDQIGLNDDSINEGKKLQNSVVGLISRFLPSIEAFFVVNATSLSDMTGAGLKNNNLYMGQKKLVAFVGKNKVLLNALLRSNASLLDKGFRALIHIPQCRPFLDFDVKRQWFKSQVKRLRQNASRRHGNLRLTIRRQNVFEDAYHQLRLRNADELRGRLHITFRNEEGVDAGGLSREFFGILAKEMFDPNYALFTSTEDGCTFQPNQRSDINPDHLTYFRFVGRIVGKAVVDGFLLDAHFTRSLYKHMLGIKPTHHDMQAIDPDYYKNLKMILEYNLEDLGLDLTFSTEVHSFGESQVIDLLPNGRNKRVTEENKEEYVNLICQHRMTTAIEEQIKAYLDGFHELVKPDLISIFTAKELELLISGMPEIDIYDLKKHTDYHGYKSSDKEITWFWNIMLSLSRSEKAAFLQFATGSSKVPLAGFAELQGMRGVQKFSIHKAGGSSGALMSAHTCFNALDLPVYKSEEEMKEKLLYAIQEGGGGFLFA